MVKNKFDNILCPQKKRFGFSSWQWLERRSLDEKNMVKPIAIASPPAVCIYSYRRCVAQFPFFSIYCTTSWSKIQPGSLCILLQLKGGVCILVAIDIIGIFNLEKKSFFLIPVYSTHPPIWHYFAWKKVRTIHGEKRYMFRPVFRSSSGPMVLWPWGSIPYVKGVSEEFRRILGSVSVTTHFTPPGSLRQSLVHPKDRVPKGKKTNVVYRAVCGVCGDDYVGETQ